MRRIARTLIALLSTTAFAQAQTSNPISQQPAATLPLSGSELVLLDQMTNGKYVTKVAPASAFLGAIPTGTITASMLASGAAAGNLGFLPARVVNVMAYGATGDGVTDDTVAFAAAIGAVNAIASSGQSACLTIPRGIFYINGSPLPSFTPNTAGGVCGAGAWKSIIKLGTSYSGDLFSWSDSWMAGVYNGGNTSITTPQKLGPRVTGLTIIGDNTAAAQQNAFMFYDHNDFVHMSDVDVHNLHGRALGAGIIKNDTDAYIRESRFDNVRVFNSGSSSVPAVEITSQCNSGCTGADATNSIDVSRMDIYGARGIGLAVRNAGPSTGGTMRAIHMAQIRVEGTEGNTYGITTDLVKIGDAAMSGPIVQVTCVDCAIASPYLNNYALNITGANAATAPAYVQFSGVIAQGGGAGYALNIGAGNHLALNFLSLSSAQTNVTVASSATTSGPIIIDGNGADRLWTWNIDPSAIQYVNNGHSLYGNPTANSGAAFLSAQAPDGTFNFGNNRGVGSVDWQTSRFNAAQAATGNGATIGGGANNMAPGDLSTVAGGNTNSAAYGAAVGGGYGNAATGTYSAAAGGINGSSLGMYGASFHASGMFAIQGDAELLGGVLRAATSSTGATRLTADQTAANGVNIWNLPDNYALTFDLACVYRDTTNGKSQSWKWLGVLMSRVSGAGSLSVAAPAATNGQNIGSPGATAPTLSADTTNGGLNITFTAPNSNASHIVCGMSGVVSG